MSNEERQRILRQAGSRPAQAETEQAAQESHEAKRREEAEIRGEDDVQPGERERPTPLAEEPEGPPRPRR